MPGMGPMPHPMGPASELPPADVPVDAPAEEVQVVTAPLPPLPPGMFPRGYPRRGPVGPRKAFKPLLPIGKGGTAGKAGAIAAALATGLLLL